MWGNNKQWQHMRDHHHVIVCTYAAFRLRDCLANPVAGILLTTITRRSNRSRHRHPTGGVSAPAMEGMGKTGKREKKSGCVNKYQLGVRGLNLKRPKPMATASIRWTGAGLVRSPLDRSQTQQPSQQILSQISTFRIEPVLDTRHRWHPSTPTAGMFDAALCVHGY